MFYISGNLILDAYYIVNDTNDPIAVKATEIRKQEYLFWREVKPCLLYTSDAADE